MEKEIKNIWLTAGGIDQKLNVDKETYSMIMRAKTASNITEVLLYCGGEEMLVKIDDLHILQ